MSENKYLENIFEQLDYVNGLVGNKSDMDFKGQPLKYNLAKQTFSLISEVDQIYFSGEHPLIYFKNLSGFDPVVVKKLHKKVWNQGRVPLMFISFPGELRIYNCYQKPLNEDEIDIQSLEIDRFTDSVEEIIRLKNGYRQELLDSGLFWDTNIGKKISTTNKVDQLLVKNLKETRKVLLQSFPKENINSLSYIHNLLGRSLFILYLQDRGIINSKYYAKFYTTATDYFSLLSDKNASFTLFKELNHRFNGDLFTVTSEEEEIVDLSHLELVRKCFYGHDAKTGQMSMWRIFDFSFIPIELISSIYEEFLHTEEGDVAISNSGAYYTPLPLVEFVLNEVLPYPDNRNCAWDLKILDPACGSGIFLVEAYRRLIERWRFANSKETVSVEILRKILIHSIFGVELNQEAIKVASFSLYLTILNYLEPKSIWANTNIKFPHLINSQSKAPNSQGANLFHGDTFINEDYFSIDYDLIIGNPPWKRGNLSLSLTNYIKKHAFANEAVIPFLHKMVTMAPSAKIALVSTAKILFNHTKGYENFRKFLFNETTVSTIVNFSQLRNSKGEIGKKLFQSASGASCLIIYQGKSNDESQEICYCCPKPNFRDSSISEIIIDSSDIKFLPRELAKGGDTKLWKVGMYGTLRDFNLLNKIKRNSFDIKKYSKQHLWFAGCGYQTSEPKKYDNQEIKRLPHIPASSITRYYSPIINSVTINDKIFRREGMIEAYNAPHVLIKAGQSKKEFCSSFLDYDCSFRDTVYGISSAGDESKLKALSAILNSTYATYFFFLTSSNWGIGREKMNFDEIMRLPVEKLLDDDKLVESLCKNMDSIIQLRNEFVMDEESKIRMIEEDINLLINQSLKITKTESYLIKNVVDTNLDFFQEGAKSKAILSVNDNEVNAYLEAACENMSKIIGSGKTNFWASKYGINNNSLVIISFHFNNIEQNGTILHNSSENMDKVLKNLNQMVYQQHSESIYFRKIVKYYDQDILFLIKPNEKRFWTQSVALEDSDNVAIEMIVHDYNE
ncbi:HsdM family class I SAM-dependent methyltransferase [Pedobacter sp. MR2016-24]|uniref:HsdM family class I SAM-dependent methyltransferase n=1 Tax=Pedobacter sp. MR2016-24 TaxID=2994466 RepID=UPI002245843D|nr:N-6 DNA methylase [Pedobacter sp. MR2016-24]MCX2483520.1 N-6 DNA methylase [Pedobacter sp. MR2016-24]